MSTAIFIRSYSEDLPWLSYCLRSIHKFASGFSEIIVAVPEPELHLFKHLTAERVLPVHDGKPGYLCQQVDKLNADIHTHADHILHVDSDTVFTSPITPRFFFRDGKPIWVITPFDKATEDEKKAWLHVIVKCLREMPPYEFMRRGCLIVPRDVYGLFRAFIERVHKQKMESYVMNQLGNEFSEYNCLGFFAWLNRREQFYWHDTVRNGIQMWPWKQYWSHTRITPAEREEMERFLS